MLRIRPPQILALLLTIACGPPRVGTNSGDDGTTSGGTETSTNETGEPTTTTTTEGPDFVPDPDHSSVTECDPFMQDCPEGQKCAPYGSTGGNWDAHKCVPILGDQAPGEPCWYGGVVEATDNCDETSMCWDVMDVDGEPIGVCTPFCTGSADAPECPPSSSCLIAGDSTLNLCVSHCHPLIQDCNDGLGCFFDGDSFNCIFTTQDIPAGEPCGFINDCAAGLGCVAAESIPACEGSACCTAFCDLNLGDGPCEALLPGTVCSSFFEENMAPSGYEDLGMCRLSP